MQYTAEQQAIINHAGGHARIIAVAGSGKTQTLTAYVQRRLELGVSPKRLLVLMYNKAAQLDFERRLTGVGLSRKRPDVRTFHSLGYRICQTLMKQGDMPAFNRNLLSDSEIEPVVWRLLRELADESVAEDVLSKKKKWVEPAMSFFELVKSSLAAPEVVFEQTGLPSQCQFYIEAFHHFEDWRAQQKRLTFSDLIYEPVQRFIIEPRLAQQFAGHMDEIIVDEYQDINPVQQYLVDVLRGDRAQLMVVGDPDQTIYEFRGSKPSLLTTELTNKLANVTDYHLSHTFRFGDSVSLLANQVIAANYDDKHPRTLCYSHESTPNTNVQLKAVKDSASAALEQVQLWSKTRPLTDIAVINRLWANSARLELLLLAAGVSYRMDNQQTVLERYELRPFRVLFQLASGQAYEWDKRTRRAAWQALLTQPFMKVKKAVIDDVLATVIQCSGKWGVALRNAVPDSLSRYQSDLLFERARIIDKAERAQAPAADVVHGWIQATDYFAAIKDNAFSAAQVEDQIATVRAFAQFVRQVKWPLVSAAEQLAILASQKVDDETPAVLITSIHKSKGREWPCVIIPELNDRFYPYQSEGEFTREASIQSERRLLYVAITRAAQQLVVLVPSVDADVPTSQLMPDAFISGLAAFLQQVTEPAEAFCLPSAMHKQSVQQYADFKKLGVVTWQTQSASNADKLVDSTVRHPNLGVGQVLRVSEKRIVIRFLKDGKEREFERAIVMPLLKAT